MTVKTFKDMNGTAVKIGDMVSVGQELPTNDHYEGGFIVTRISKKGRNIIVYMENEIHGEIGLNKQYIVSEM